MTQLIECIPNFSEARRPEVIDQIVAAITSVEGASLLDRSSDLDHNRTVLTFAGSPEAVEEAAFRAIKTAAELIDLNQHTGAHPRIGATDVCPFVPLCDVTMEECIAIAKRLGQRVGSELNIPVYLYEAAATRPERANLENIRKGQYEGLKVRNRIRPERKPDFGPANLAQGGSNRHRRAQSADRLQCLSHHRRCQHRQEDRQSHSSVIGRTSLRQRAWLARGWPRAGLDEPHQLPRDADCACG